MERTTIADASQLTPETTWNFSQVFGDRVENFEDIQDGKTLSFLCKRHYVISHCLLVADIISALQFSHDGDYLATGDRGGRVVLFERNSNDVCQESSVT